MLNGSTTDLGVWRSCRIEGTCLEHSRGEDGTSTTCFCSAVPLLLCHRSILGKFRLGGDLDLMLWSSACGDKSNGGGKKALM